ncbi:MAG: hypothetical protein B7Z75_03975 [Acidocella sp. 20-57-95]|nr:MAG: hypothetical protein B7Z75_03975 [Acidocella sp. 20-57-95]
MDRYFAPVGRTILSTKRVGFENIGSHAEPVAGIGEHGHEKTAMAQRRMVDRQLRVALSDILHREANLPPSGLTGFDPFLTPAWVGQKLSI